MTRINVGIQPSELCDQHLLAELREITRIFHFSGNKGPEEFTLGKGHVLWCARYKFSIANRYIALHDECLYIRKFGVMFYNQPRVGIMGVWSKSDELVARPLLIERINQRLSTMKRTPKWTNRTTPGWVK